MEDEVKSSEKINAGIRPVLEAFLAEPEYQETFKKMAKAVGYEGDDETETHIALFTVSPDGHIGFVIAELNDLFFEYQLIKNVSDQEPFKSLLVANPAKKVEVVAMAKKMMTGAEITNEDIEKLLEV